MPLYTTYIFEKLSRKHIPQPNTKPKTWVISTDIKGVVKTVLFNFMKNGANMRLQWKPYRCV